MKLVKKMDAGPIYTQKTVNLYGTERKEQLASKLLEIGVDSLIKTLPDILAGNIQPKAQDDSKATYDSLIDKKDGTIDWNKSATRIEREIRAYESWPGSRTVIAKKDVIVTEARLGSNQQPNEHVAIASINDTSIEVTAKTGTLLIDKLKPAGKSEMSAEAFIAGHKQQLISPN